VRAGKSRTQGGDSAWPSRRSSRRSIPAWRWWGDGLGLNERERERFVAATRAAVYDPAARELPVRSNALGPGRRSFGAACGAVDSSAQVFGRKPDTD
jgi:hypothetical protein